MQESEYDFKIFTVKINFGLIYISDKWFNTNLSQLIIFNAL